MWYRRGQVTLDEFEDYYANLSGLIEDDTYFEEIISSTWKVSSFLQPPRPFCSRRMCSKSTAWLVSAARRHV
jgi:hypothetical protein